MGLVLFAYPITMEATSYPTVEAIHAAFLGAAQARIRQQSDRILDCLGRLSEDQIWERSNAHSNAVGNLVLHLMGNLGQWVVHGIGGAADTRQRDLEFSTRGGVSREELADRFRQRIEQVIGVIGAVPPDRLLEEIAPQGYRLPVMECITHITEHLYYHGGQIILITKFLLDVDLGYYRHLEQNNQVHGEKVP